MCGIPAILAIVVGVLAMRETKRTGQRGYGYALVGTVWGALVVVGCVVFFAAQAMGRFHSDLITLGPGATGPLVAYVYAAPGVAMLTTGLRRRSSPHTGSRPNR